MSSLGHLSSLGDDRRPSGEQRDGSDQNASREFSTLKFAQRPGSTLRTVLGRGKLGGGRGGANGGVSSPRGHKPGSGPRNFRGRHETRDGGPKWSSARRATNIDTHPLEGVLHQLEHESIDEIIKVLSNKDNKLDEFLKSNLPLEQYMKVLSLLKKVGRANMSTQKIFIMTQACQPEFLRQFNTFLLQTCTKMDPQLLSGLFQDILMFFELVARHLPTTACDQLKPDASAILACARGSQKLNPEMIEKLEKFIQDLDTIKKVAKDLNMKRASRREQAMAVMQVMPPPNDFRDMNLYPDLDDIFIKTQPFLRPIVVQGGYQSVEHYLDVQFRLLREDYIRPLREGILEHLDASSIKRRCESSGVRVYNDVEFLGSYQENKEELEKKKKGAKQREGIVVQFKVQRGRRPINWDKFKGFMYGSLLCFTQNNFKTLIFATVSDRDDIQDGKLLVKLCENYEENIYQSKKFTMVECEVFFEPYFQVLKTLKTLNKENFPMEDYIVNVNNAVVPPRYLSGRHYLGRGDGKWHDMLEAGLIHEDDVIVDEREDEVVYTLRGPKPRNEYEVTVLDQSTWPSARQLGLDDSQYKAFFTALTSELAVIQGPPGTGKTFMALKIAQTLIDNKHEMGRGTPILVVCLTNHALDQFLMGILKFTNDVIRIGGQSKCEEMSKYNLKNRGSKFTFNEFKKFKEYREDAEGLITVDLPSVRNEIECYEDSSQLLTLTGISNLNLCTNRSLMRKLGGGFLSWLLGIDLPVEFPEIDQVQSGNPFLYPWEEIREKIYHSRGDIFSEQMQNLQLQQGHSGIPNGFKETLQEQINWHLNCLLQALASLHDDLQNIVPSSIEIDEKIISDPWELSIVERRQLYVLWRESHLNFLRVKMYDIEKRLSRLQLLIDELKLRKDVEALSCCDVIGMTTTGAARLHNMLKMVKCQIVIVEEAAEVMESHVIACLTNHCEHLILIGDHKQLRPHTEVYELARYYNFDVSLFERLVRNKVRCETLGVQHRMAPLLATLVVPAIYPELLNDPSTLERPPVNGLPKRLFFIAHNEPELKDVDISSRRNEHEAEFLLALCNHLILQGYAPEQITILTTYKGQMFSLQYGKRQNPRLQGVYITVVDNFQGEENDIILLSLVRSNEEGNIGFLATENRVCVALSRARQGLYIIGNMDILESKSELWRKIKASLLEAQGFGTALPLRCQVHPDERFEVATASDFKRLSPEGGCTKICTVTLPCSHICEQTCHALNRDHEKVKCLSKNPCLRKCEAGLHDCKKKCNQDCGNCNEMVTKELPCKHKVVIRCFQDPTTFPCREIVEKEFQPCGHKADVVCSAKQCPKSCEDRLDCGHACVKFCHAEDDPDHLKYVCTKQCTKKNKDCTQDHECKLRCCDDCQECNVMVKKKRSCGHQFDVKCTDDPDKIICKNKCRRVLSCGHWCTKLCWDECEPCQREVEKVIEDCGHKVKVKCGEPATQDLCKMKCEKDLPCGHKCTNKCSKACTQECKERVGFKESLCGHQIPVLCSDEDQVVQSYDALKRCKKNCTAILACQHECTGTCQVCNQGRFHQLCKKPCDRILICGHKCKAPCYMPCPPCTQRCQNQCPHTKCQQQCGMNCFPICKEKCNWRCPHQSCQQKCGEGCKRSRCEEECTKIRPDCGHQCSGLCGEPCPPLCWVCDCEQLIKEAIDLNSEEPPENPRFVVLPTCKHIVEVSTLEKWMTWQNTEVQLRSCPRCDTSILNVGRYKVTVREAFTDLQLISQSLRKSQNEVQTEITGTKSALSVLERSINVHLPGQAAELVVYLQELRKLLPDANNTSSKKKGPQFLNADLVHNINLCVLILDKAVQLASKVKPQLYSSLLEDHPHLGLNSITSFMAARRQTLNRQELEDMRREFTRLDHLALASNKVKNPDVLKNMIDHLAAVTTYTNDQQKQTLDMARGWFDPDDCQRFRFDLPLQSAKDCWKRCEEDHLFYHGSVPQRSVLHSNCTKCDALPLVAERPSVLAAPKPVDQGRSDLDDQVKVNIGYTYNQRQTTETKKKGDEEPKQKTKTMRKDGPSSSREPSVAAMMGLDDLSSGEAARGSREYPQDSSNTWGNRPPRGRGGRGRGGRRNRNNHNWRKR